MVTMPVGSGVHPSMVSKVNYAAPLNFNLSSVEGTQEVPTRTTSLKQVNITKRLKPFIFLCIFGSDLLILGSHLVHRHL